MRTFILTAFIAVSIWVHSQTRVADSLRRLIELAPPDTNKVFLLNSLAWELRNPGKGPALGLPVTEDAMRLSDKLRYPRGYAQALHVAAFTYRNIGKSRMALKKMKKRWQSVSK